MNKYLIEAKAISNIGTYNIYKALHSFKESEPKYKIEDNLNRVSKRVSNMIKNTEENIINKLEDGCNNFYKKVDAKLHIFEEMISLAIKDVKGTYDYNNVRNNVIKELLTHSKKGNDEIDKSFVMLENDLLEQASNIKKSVYIIDQYEKYFSEIDINGDKVTDKKKSILYSKVDKSNLIDILESTKKSFLESSLKKLQLYINKFKEIYDALISEIPEYGEYIKPSVYGNNENTSYTISDFKGEYFKLDRFMKLSKTAWPIVNF